MRTLARLTITTTLALFACSSPSDDSPPVARTPRLVTAASPALSKVASGNATFAWSLYDKFRADAGNIFYSPFSVSAALGMTYAGAAHNTASQMEQVLAIQDAPSFHKEFGALVRDLNGLDKTRGYRLAIANRLFHQEGQALEPTFLSTVSDDYGAGLESVDFASSPEPARAHINLWVSDQTNAKIPALLPEGSIDGDTVLVLVNAIYFDADWAIQFQKGATQERAFTLKDGTEVQVPTMFGTQGFKQSEVGPVRTLEIPYKDRELSMLVFIPASGSSLEQVETELSAKGVEPFVPSGDESELDVYLPKFEMRYKRSLSKDLKSMGMNDAFEPGLADFTNIARNGAFYIGDVLHEAYVRVDEEGTEAAAATAVEMKAVSASPSFEVNQPFVFVIRDRLTESILFTGRVVDPR